VKTEEQNRHPEYAPKLAILTPVVMNEEDTEDFWRSLRPVRLADIQAELDRMNEPVPEPDSSIIRYVDCLLWGLATRGGREIVLRRSQPLPAPELPEVKLDRTPTFDEAIARLKKMCGVREDGTPGPLDGVINAQIAKRDYRFSVRFEDADADPSCRITVEEEGS